ncbi:MAG: Xaa-Pro peptidase family protein [Mariprofundaceae bacterium]
MSGKQAKLLICDSEHHADMLYVSGIFAPDPFIVIGLDGEWHGLFSPLEVDRARKQSRLQQVHLDAPWRQQAAQHGWPTGLASAAAAFLRQRKVEQLLVPGNFPLQYADQLRGLGFEVAACNGTLFPQRAIKSQLEVAHLQRAVNICKSAMRQAEAFLRQTSIGEDDILRDPENGKRLKSADLRQTIETHIVAKGAVPSHTITACGNEAADPHNIGRGFLRAHQSIIIDIFPRDGSGYWGDMTRTFVKGKAGAKLRKMYRTVREGQDIGLSMLSDGVSGIDIHRSILAHFEKQGFPTGEKRGRQMGFFHGTGHGVGLDVHEQPRISAADGTLQTGHVVTVEPGLYYHGLGGVRLEDMAVITRNGHHNFTRYPRRLEIA